VTQDEDELSLKEFYNYTVSQIGREESLINNRLSWMLTFQGFLFAAIALVTDVGTDPAIRIILRNLVPIVGLVIGAFTLIGVHAAYLSINNIKAKCKERKERKERLGDRPLYPPAHGTPTAHRLGKIPSYGIPTMVVIAWLLFLLLLIKM